MIGDLLRAQHLETDILDGVLRLLRTPQIPPTASEQNVTVQLVEQRSGSGITATQLLDKCWRQVARAIHGRVTSGHGQVLKTAKAAISMHIVHFLSKPTRCSSLNTVRGQPNRPSG